MMFQYVMEETMCMEDGHRPEFPFYPLGNTIRNAKACCVGMGLAIKADFLQVHSADGTIDCDPVLLLGDWKFPQIFEKSERLLPLRFCPWCGEIITFEKVGHERIRWVNRMISEERRVRVKFENEQIVVE